jgi:hypothetical protein
MIALLSANDVIEIQLYNTLPAGSNWILSASKGLEGKKGKIKCS